MLLNKHALKKKNNSKILILKKITWFEFLDSVLIMTMKYDNEAPQTGVSSMIE